MSVSQACEGTWRLSERTLGRREYAFRGFLRRWTPNSDAYNATATTPVASAAASTLRVLQFTPVTPRDTGRLGLATAAANTLRSYSSGLSGSRVPTKYLLTRPSCGDTSILQSSRRCCEIVACTSVALITLEIRLSLRKV